MLFGKKMLCNEKVERKVVKEKKDRKIYKMDYYYSNKGLSFKSSPRSKK
jgi:hypothetical protein